MSLSPSAYRSWLRSLKKSLSRRPRREHGAARVQPRIETLEERVVLTTYTNPVAPQLIVGLYDTGVNDGAANSTLASTSTDPIKDPHYVLTHSDDTTGAGVAQGQQALVHFNTPAVNQTGGTAIGPTADPAANLSVGYYEYQTTFNLTGFNPAGASISGTWQGDDAGNDIILNGHSTGLRSDTNPNFTITNSSATPFLPGLNTLAFRVHNNGQVGGTINPNPTDLDVTNLTLTDTDLLVTGTGNDTLTINATGANSGSYQLDNGPVIDFNSITSFTFNDLTGKSTFVLNAPAGADFVPTFYTGSGAGSVANLNGNGSTATADLGTTPPTVTGGGLGTVTLANVDTVNLGNGGGDITVTGSAPSELDVTPTGTLTATVTTPGSNVAINTFNSGTLLIDGGAGANTVTVNGTAGNDTIGVDRTVNPTVTVNSLKTVTVSSPDTSSLVVDTGKGIDSVSVTGNGFAGPGSGQTLTINGDATPRADTLTVTNTSGTSTTTVSPGESSDAGTVSDTTDGDVAFTGMTDVFVNGVNGGTNSLVADGHDANDTLSLLNSGGLDSIAVNEQAIIRFTNFSTVTLEGFAGDDTFDVSPTGLTGPITAINVFGGPGDNTLMVNGSTGADTTTFAPTGADAGSITVTPTAGATIPVTFSTTQLVDLDGQGGGDNLDVTAPAGSNTITFNEGDLADSGNVQIQNVNGGTRTSLVPLDFDDLGVGTGNGVTLTGKGTDTELFNGTTLDDTFTVAVATGIVTASNVLPSGATLTHLPVIPVGITSLTLDGLAGNNAVIYNGDPSETYGFTAQGSRVQLQHNLGMPNINLFSTDAARLLLNVARGVNSITVNDLSNTGVTQVDLNLDNGPDHAVNVVTVNGRNTADSLDVIPGVGKVSVTGMPYVVNADNSAPPLDVLIVNGAGGNDTLRGEPGVQQLIDLTMVGGAGNVTFSGYGRFQGGPGQNTYDASNFGSGVTIDLNTQVPQLIDNSGNYVQLLNTFQNYIGTSTRDYVSATPTPVGRNINSAGGTDVVTLDTVGHVGVLTPTRVGVQGTGTVSFESTAQLNFVNNSLVIVSPEVASVTPALGTHHRSGHLIHIHVSVKNISNLHLHGPFALQVVILSHGVTLNDANGTATRVTPAGSPVVVFQPNSADDLFTPGEVITVDLAFRTRTGRVPKFTLGLLEGPGTL